MSLCLTKYLEIRQIKTLNLKNWIWNQEILQILSLFILKIKINRKIKILNKNKFNKTLKILKILLDLILIIKINLVHKLIIKNLLLISTMNQSFYIKMLSNLIKFKKLWPLLLKDICLKIINFLK